MTESIHYWEFMFMFKHLDSPEATAKAIDKWKSDGWEVISETDDKVTFKRRREAWQSESDVG